MMELLRVRRLGWLLLVLMLVAGPALQSCRPYRLPNPSGPVTKKTKTKKKDPEATEMADGSTGTASTEAPKIQKNSYDKNGLLKKPKYKRRRLAKPGEKFILGVRIPAWPWISFKKKNKTRVPSTVPSRSRHYPNKAKSAPADTPDSN
ncbi:hypothetical protein [Hymenobacter latericus]|uniref:hypothetical protein n=1 Tax=Hymenobacter sp. YIM 151858-1 TaxID=2987688 RepID=UPI0022276767|nr:hypothetical protein [Hymenobacter sp. YIM 151858-1]UYZ58021.1 hypothetical protein OIS50_13245 [Hymenobacter sp. YIM 151858-1]